MGAASFRGLETTGMHKILCLLDGLRQSPTGVTVYRQVERMLEDLVDTHQGVEQAYLVLIKQLLEVYSGHLRAGSALQVQVKFLQARLQPPLTEADMASLRDYIEVCASQIDAFKQLDADAFRQAVEPLLVSFGIVDKESHVEEPTVESVEPVAEAAEPLEAPPTVEAETEAGTAPPPAAASEELTMATTAGRHEGEVYAPASEAQVSATAQPAKREGPYSGLGTGTPIVGESGEEEESGEEDDRRVDTTYRSHLDSKRRDILKLQATLAEQVLATISQNEEFGVLLEVVLGELRQAGDGKELEDLRWTLIREIEKLTKGHHELAEKLDSTHHYLQLIESDSRQLSDELTRVRLLSLTDELTGLPNRRAFLRRIEDEVARVQRYGFPLSLALIDLDHFKQINDKYGHAGGDEVLQIYSKNILSIFRHHDLVARYGGEEFAVLLPNTDAEGALRALTKVKNRAGETRWQANGDTIPVPTFSSGVSLYKPGETASAFIERADKALYRAKRLGRNRVEMDATYQSDTEAEDTPSTDDARNHS
ncbi:MAG: GGDEF domain-containing protein [Thiogranum sp.]